MGFGFLHVYMGLGRDVMELWWEMGLTQWCAACFCGKADLFPHLSFGCRLDCVFIVGTLLFGAFLSLFSLSLAFNLFARFLIGVILFSIILLSLCLSLGGRFVASALLNMLFLVDSILASMVLARFL